MRHHWLLAILILAGCGSKGPAVVSQTRPTVDGARRDLARQCAKRAEEAIGKVPDTFLRYLAIEKLIEAESRLGDIASAKKLAQEVAQEGRASQFFSIAREQGLNGDLTGARETLAAGRALIHDESMWDISEMGMAQAMMGDLKEARKTCAKLPSHMQSEILVTIAECEQRAGATSSAKDDLNAARQADKENTIGSPYLVLGWYHAGDLPTAEACINEMQDPLDQAESWIALAWEQQHDGANTTALSSLRRAQKPLAMDSGSIFKQFRLRVQCAHELWKCGDESAKALLIDARGDVAKQFTNQRDYPEQIWSYGNVAAAQLLCGDATGSDETMRLAMAGIPGLPDDKTRAAAIWCLAAAAAATGDVERAQPLIDQAMQYAIPHSQNVPDSYQKKIATSVQGIAMASASTGAPDLTWMERLPPTEQANAYAAAACVLSEAPKAVRGKAGR